MYGGRHRNKNEANKGVQGTLHKVSGPLTPDVVHKTMIKRIFPSVRLEWKEPKAFRRINDQIDAEALSPFFRPGIVVFISVLSMLTWWLSDKPDKLPLHYALLLALFGGAFFAYIFPWILGLCPSCIRIYDHGISRVIGNMCSMWKFKNIDRCEFVTYKIGAVIHSALVLHTRKAKHIILGIPSELTAQARQTLDGIGVATEENAQQSVPAYVAQGAPSAEP
mgnify:CR=1 FL=1